MLEWKVANQEAGHKLIVFLASRLNNRYSARFLKQIIERNGCEINGRTERFASTLLAEGDHVVFYLDETTTRAPLFEAKRVLFEDEALLVYDKPPGIACDEQGILQFFKDQVADLQLVHRLDRDTSGVLILAKQAAVFEKLVEQFKQFQVKKRYVALVDGTFQQTHGVIENYLGKKKSYAGQTIWGAVDSASGQWAYTEWQLLKNGQSCAWITCRPKTGRTHQLRVHLAGIGHPILGDYQYGKAFRCPYRPERMLLHAEDICFYHPFTGKFLTIQAPLPDDFKQVIDEYIDS